MSLTFNPSQSRREFLAFFGRSTAAVAAISAFPFALTACSTTRESALGRLPFQPMLPSTADELKLVPGLQYTKVLEWGDSLNAQGERFGFNNDFLQFFAAANKTDEGVLWVNHEYLNPSFIHGRDIDRKSVRSKKEIETEMDAVGGSLVAIRRSTDTGHWEMVKNSPYNRRVTGRTPIPFAGNQKIKGSSTAIGTLGNCAGGRTPWGTVLTCEENYQDFYVDREIQSDGTTRPMKSGSDFVNWSAVFNHPPEHYGWVVEVNPWTGAAQKHVSLGRFGHECATVRQAADGRCVVYSGDDWQEKCLYKFVADQPGNLEKGTLYTANLERGEWIPLDLEKSPVLKKLFKNQTDVLIYARQAAELVGGTKCHRPEDIEICPRTGAVYIAMTNCVIQNDYHGYILKLEEENNDPLSLKFKSSTFLAGGPDATISCPDNLAFDPKGNLWVTSDISSSKIGKGDYQPFGNNGLFFVPMSGPSAGLAFQVASAPVDAEFTGPLFSPDGKTLFLSVQHPGEESPSIHQLTSHWPNGGSEIPRSAVVAIEGPTLQKIYDATSLEG